MSLNRVFVMGNLGQDPELRFTPNQTPVLSMSVATTEYRSVDGQRQDQTEWHRIVVWGKQAENCAKFLKKGRTVFVEGRLQTRSWDDKNGGGKRYATEIIAQNVRFVGGATGRAEGDSATHGYSGAGQEDQYGSASSSYDVGFGGGPGGPSLDDIPF